MLKQELENFQDLLEEDPDCKWALYTKVLIMKTIDPVKYHQEIVKDFDMLCQIGKKYALKKYDQFALNASHLFSNI